MGGIGLIRGALIAHQSYQLPRTLACKLRWIHRGSGPSYCSHTQIGTRGRPLLCIVIAPVSPTLLPAVLPAVLPACVPLDSACIPLDCLTIGLRARRRLPPCVAELCLAGPLLGQVRQPCGSGTARPLIMSAHGEANARSESEYIEHPRGAGNCLAAAARVTLTAQSRWCTHA